MREPDDWEDDIILAAILSCELNLYRTYVHLNDKLIFLLQWLNFLMLQMDAINFNLILI